ncbi:hypothetical protein GYMLUDRAFT_246358 [Collybiopsis luxurians FD-317 M1]|uniref:Uncharacterized protein n=1 Tax=Collybiopsis luxurians FD-317 M1 TaxID=944289 RepID=A0A0D0BRW0_9AGAR|nr:hypothetical protein GYMLUDRAFT_246358 [Collybiopsis luxurians FD-317 M1]
MTLPPLSPEVPLSLAQSVNNNKWRQPGPSDSVLHLGQVDISCLEINVLCFFRNGLDGANPIAPFGKLDNSPTRYAHKCSGNKHKSASNNSDIASSVEQSSSAAPSQHKAKQHKRASSDTTSNITPVDSNTGRTHCLNSGNQYRALIDAQGASSLGTTGKGAIRW